LCEQPKKIYKCLEEKECLKNILKLKQAASETIFNMKQIATEASLKNFFKTEATCF